MAGSGAVESSKFWLCVLNEVKSRGIKTVDLFCVDGLTGFREAINEVYPFSGIQRCIIHQICSSTKYVSYKHITCKFRLVETCQILLTHLFPRTHYFLLKSVIL